jgi:hypothetical protein
LEANGKTKIGSEKMCKEEEEITLGGRNAQRREGK